MDIFTSYTPMLHFFTYSNTAPPPTGHKVPRDEIAIALGVDVKCDVGFGLKNAILLEVPQHFENPREALAKYTFCQFFRT